mmetsp:Transcript_6253/g.11107  ORF Transcript_6253/g.11107 Transcript_6253/m.11107 type:complete len:92 (-) Transcript_6253:51-326(-)
MEKKMSVKVVFDDETGHVFLVGDSKKLEKKCFPIRNMVSHYHWRLSWADGGSDGRLRVHLFTFFAKIKSSQVVAIDRIIHPWDWTWSGGGK